MTRTRQQLAVAVLVLVALLALQVALRAGGNSFGDLSREPTTIAQLPWWNGALSVLTGLLWAACSVLLLVASRLGDPALSGRLTAWGVLVGVIALDDSMSLHESALPSIGIREELVLAVYAVWGLLLAWRMLPLRDEPLGQGFFVGAAALGTSAIWDQVVGAVLLAEDGLKLAAACLWILCGVWALQDRAVRT